ncbi:MAG: hypothetical protein JWO02_3206 [Solirubrobacterales bacterium]|nr:hypothetical protein [Solirubrobacterales bacterium]
MGKRSRKRPDRTSARKNTGAVASPMPARPRPEPARRRTRPDRGERPAALWGRAPISEFAILAGTIALVVGMSRGPGPGTPAITVGLVLVGIASLEFAGREHLRGYRSHSFFLALGLTGLLHLAMVVVAGSGTVPVQVLLVLDVVAFGLLFSALSRQFSIVRVEARQAQRR